MPLGDYSGRENQWTISSPSGGTIVTANYVLGTASGNTLCGIKNPHGTLPAYIKRAVIVIVTGTGVGPFVWGVSPASQAISITSTGATGARNNTYFQQVTNGTATQPMQAFAGDTINSVLAGSTANTVAMFRPFAAPGAGTVTAGNNYVWEETLDGELTVGPGCFCGLFPTAAGTGTAVIQAAITFGVGA